MHMNMTVFKLEMQKHRLTSLLVWFLLILSRNFSWKIRTITVGIPFTNENTASAINFKQLITKAVKVGKELQHEYENCGIEVQTIRLCTPPFETWGHDEIEAKLAGIHPVLEELGVEFFSIGPATSRSGRAVIAQILQKYPRISASAEVGVDEDGNIDQVAAVDAARIMYTLSTSTEGGLGNFRFCASFCCPAGIPFFPGSYADKAFDGTLKISIGLENGDIAMRAFQDAGGDLAIAKHKLRAALIKVARAVEGPAEAVCERVGPTACYRGLDTSLNPALNEEGSVAGAIEAVLAGRPFGAIGTLEVCAAITDVLKSIPCRQAGYCGLMLPPMEDLVLARRAASPAGPTYGLRDLLAFSSVCGVGLDTVPVPGGGGGGGGAGRGGGGGGGEDEETAAVAALAAVVREVAALGHKWGKPLSCRLFPVTAKQAHELTEFDSPYMCNTKIFEI